MTSLLSIIVPLTLTAGAQKSSAPSEVSRLLATKLPALGHRNWVVVVDAAYPLQTSAGIETITVLQNQISAVKDVLSALGKTKHVRPTIYIDSELKFINDAFAPGISTYRKNLNSLLSGKTVQRLLHEDIIAKLDEAGKTFHVLVIKTPHIQPYTSVFFQLECGYWTGEAEKQLRESMKGKG